MPRPKRFYVVATGQAQANLPPLYALAGHGDSVVWIETPLAKQKGYSVTSQAVLAKRLGSPDPEDKLSVSDADILNPDRLKEILLADIGTHPDADPILIATGGPKYMMFGVDRAACKLGFPVAYTDIGSAELLTLAHPSGSFTHGPLTNPITLDEWLAVNRLELCSTFPPPIEIWPTPSLGAPLDPARDLAFASDSACQRAFFAIHRAKAKKAKELAGQAPPSEIPDEFTATDGFRLDWRKLADHISHRPVPNGNDVRALRSFLARQARRAAAMQRPPLSLDPAAVDQLKQDRWLDPEFDPANPGAPSHRQFAAGDRFEEAVALRVQRFVQINPRIAAIISGIFLKVSIASPEDPLIRFTELDVAILLKNATLIHLECKCGREADESDTYYRLGKLQHVGKSGASLVFCIPMFPELAGSPEFEFLYEPYRRIVGLQAVNLNLGLIFYTNPGQTGPFECSPLNHDPFNVIPFEHGLTALLGRYVPKT